jgi:hypothetical protein
MYGRGTLFMPCNSPVVRSVSSGVLLKLTIFTKLNCLLIVAVDLLTRFCIIYLDDASSVRLLFALHIFVTKKNGGERCAKCV